MPGAVKPERFLRLWPGRIRIEVSGLLGNKPMAALLGDTFGRVSGVLKTDACAATGRLLVIYDEGLLRADDIFRLILKAEGHPENAGETANNQPFPVPEAVSAGETASGEAAAAAECDPEIAGVREMGESGDPADSGNPGNPGNPGEADLPTGVPGAIRMLPSVHQARASPAVPISFPLGLAMGGLAVLGVKQLLFGKSALARSPLPFYLSGLVSVVTGYPFIKRGVTRFGREKKLNTDLILGSGALALALVRENLVVLAGLSILQYVNWKRTREAPDGAPVELSAEIRAYSDKAGKLGIAAAAATWALTRDPLRGIAVLLAANPRPATIPAECAWKQAETGVRDQGIPLPDNLMMSRLGRTRTLLLEDAALLAEADVQETEIFSQEQEADKLICAAASLMEKTAHPWKEDVWRKAKSTCRTLRTAFRVEAEEDGITGTVHNSKYSVGTLAYGKKLGMACEGYYLEAKRLQKSGYDVLFVFKHSTQGAICHGLLYRKQEISPESLRLLERCRQEGLTVAPLFDRTTPAADSIRRLNLDPGWLCLSPGEAAERIAGLHQQGEDVLFVTGTEPGEYGRALQQAGIPAISFDQLGGVLDAVVAARLMDASVHEHLQITKKWNVVGTALATLGVLTAPLVNLVSDALSLVFLSRSGHTASAAFSQDRSSRHEVAAAAADLAWHASPWPCIADRFGIDERSGLSPHQVKAARFRFGANRLEQKKPVPWIVSYAGQFKEFTTLVLTATSLLAFFTGGMFDGLAMGAVLLANAAIGTYQERKAEAVLQNLNRFQPPECTVLRAGETARISAADLVPGDIVSLEAGDRVPADLRIIRSWILEVNEAALTGESVPAAKTDALVDEDSPLTDRKNMLYMGTDVCRGKALGVVVQTGMETEIGHLMALLKNEDKEVTPLQAKVTSISKNFVKWAFLAGGVVFLTGLLRGIPVTQMISTSITLAASAIPEGLPVTITIALSAGIYRMAKKKVFVRKLSALETLGRTTVICSDKTGTLTKNEMTVREIVAVDRNWKVSGNGYDLSGSIEADGDDTAGGSADALQPELQRLMQVAVLCNNSRLESSGKEWTVRGDPTEGALLFMAAKAGISPENMAEWQRCEEIPFDSKSGKMSVVCKHTDSERECYMFTKGAVEHIVRHCSRYESGGQILPLTPGIRHRITQRNEELARQALRVLGFAYRPVDVTGNRSPGDEENDLIYVGMVGMIDPPKTGVEQSIRESRAIGVMPVMITGDHPITAIAIAKQVGIYTENGRVLSGYELERMSDEQLDEVVNDVTIFARVTPEQKLRIVQSYRRRGHTVAMTGDGINDCPAIRQADVGIAMGRTGTEVTKETADIVLQEDHFGSIIEGVKEGRTIIGNIRKALGCLLTGNLAEIIVTSAAVMIGLPIPLVPIQILLMNLLTDALPAMVLAVNPGGSKEDRNNRVDIVDKPLYRKVITRGVLLGIGSLGLFAATLAAGAPVQVAQSVAFATLVAGQLMQTLNWRREGTDESLRDLGKDRFLIGALGVSWLALFAALYVPPVARFFHTAPLGLHHWFLVLSVAASVSLLSKPVLALFSNRKEGDTPSCTKPRKESLSGLRSPLPLPL